MCTRLKQNEMRSTQLLFAHKKYLKNLFLSGIEFGFFHLFWVGAVLLPNDFLTWFWLLTITIDRKCLLSGGSGNDTTIWVSISKEVKGPAPETPPPTPKTSGTSRASFFSNLDHSYVDQTEAQTSSNVGKDPVPETPPPTPVNPGTSTASFFPNLDHSYVAGNNCLSSRNKMSTKSLHF